MALSIHLYYSVRYKGHYGTDKDWIYPYSGMQNWPTQTDAAYTTLTLQTNPAANLYFPSQGQLDFQVRAIIGNVNLINGRLWGANDYYVFDGLESDWSSTQTIIISYNATTSPSETSPTPIASASSSQNPTATLSQSGAGTSLLFGWSSAEVVIAVLLGVVAVLLVFVVVFLRRRTVK